MTDQIKSTAILEEIKKDEDPSTVVHDASSSVKSPTEQHAQEWTAEEEKKLLRKLDSMLLPGLWMMQLVSHLSRNSLGNARIAGMGADLNMSSSQYSMAIVVFFITYLPLGPILNSIVVRSRPSILLPLCVISWGVVVCAHSAAKTYSHLLALRALLGMLETALSPACISLLSSWYRPDEQTKRAFVYNSSVMLGGAFGGLLAGAITGGLEGSRGFRGWQWLFIIEGGITILWGILCWFLIPDFPENSRLFEKREREVAMMRVRKVGTAGFEGKLPGREKLGKVRSVVVACTDWRTWMVTLACVCLGCSFVLPYFYPTLVRGLGYDNPVTAQYMTVPLWLVAFVWSVGVSIIGDRLSASRALLISISAGYAMIMTIAVCCVYGFVARYVLLIIMATGIWSTLPLGASFAATTFRDMPPEARAVAIGLTTIGSQTGNVYGAYLFPSEAAPKYLFGFGTIAGTQFVSSLLFFATFLLLRRRQAKIDDHRERALAGVVDR